MTENYENLIGGLGFALAGVFAFLLAYRGPAPRRHDPRLYLAGVVIFSVGAFYILKAAFGWN